MTPLHRKKHFDDHNSTSVPLLLCPTKLPHYVEGISQRWFSSQYHFFQLDSYRRNTTITHYKSFLMAEVEAGVELADISSKPEDR